MNKIFLSGNLTRDPEVKHTQAGKAWARVGIAVKRPFAKDTTDFFNLVAWDKTAELLGKYFVKGQKALIEGRLQTSNYENKDGVKVNAVDVVVDSVEFADSKRSDRNAQPDNRNEPQPAQKNDDYYHAPDDTPF